MQIEFMSNSQKFLKSFRKLFLVILSLGITHISFAQSENIQKDSLSTDTAQHVAEVKIDASEKTIYGLASFYGNKFIGKKTANGEIFSQEKFTAACNVLPLGTWIKVTNLKNGKWVIVKTNDRLHPKMKRLVDLTRAAATQLNYINRGVTKVKVEVVKKPQKNNSKKRSK